MDSVKVPDTLFPFKDRQKCSDLKVKHRDGWPIEGARVPSSLSHTHKIIIIDFI